jgi:dolichol-phosphate mannosyltransferase
MSASLASRTLVIVPTSNEADNIATLVAAILQATPAVDILFKAVQSEGYGFQIECKYRAYRAGFRFVEAPIVFTDRRVGSAKMSTRIVLEAVLRTWQLRGLRPGQSILLQKLTEREYR